MAELRRAREALNGARPASDSERLRRHVATTVKPSDHLRTAIDIIALFLDRRPVIEVQEDGTHRVTC